MRTIIVLSLALFFIFSLSKVYSASFRLGFVTDYTFYDSGIASVKKKITLTNLTTSSYPAVYFLELPQDAESVVAFDDEGKTQTSIVEEGGQKKAKIVLNQETLGFGKDVTIVLSYETATLANHTGEKWHIALPGFTSTEEIDEYTVSVTFPPDWGKPKRVIPPPDREYTWTLSARSEAPITLDFEELPTSTPIPTAAPSSVIPIAVGFSVGIIAFIILFEVLKRI